MNARLPTIREEMIRHGMFKASVPVGMFYKELVDIYLNPNLPFEIPNRSADDARKARIEMARNLIQDHLFEISGLRTWMVDTETVQVLKDMTVEYDDISTLVFPYDSFQLVFDNSTKLGKYELSGCKVSVYSVVMLSDYLKKYGIPHDQSFMDMFENERRRPQLHVRSDFGDREKLINKYWECTRYLDKPAVEDFKTDVFEGLNNDEAASAEAALDLVIKIIMLWNARPEIVSPDIPRIHRMCKPKVELKYYSMIKMPDKLLIHHRSKASGVHTGTVTPHMRGYVLRHLRHERYRRNEDGSVRTVLVEPCMIGLKENHDGPGSEEGTAAERAQVRGTGPAADSKGSGDDAQGTVRED